MQSGLIHCAAHPRVAAQGLCLGCRRPFCSRCATLLEGGYVCAVCWAARLAEGDEGRRGEALASREPLWRTGLAACGWTLLAGFGLWFWIEQVRGGGL